ncbi:MAG: DPP IV N-terminal domain-containing protein [Planctomycetota bacterium]
MRNPEPSSWRQPSNSQESTPGGRSARCTAFSTLVLGLTVGLAGGSSVLAQDRPPQTGSGAFQTEITLEQTLGGLRLNPVVPRVEVEGGLLKVTQNRGPGLPGVWFIDPKTGEDVEAPPSDGEAEPEDVPGRTLSELLRRNGGRETVSIDGVEVDEMQLAPSGELLSYVADGNLCITSPEDQGGLSWQVTADGGGDRRHGMLDWVYQEELYGRGNFQGAWWNGDGKKLAFLTIDSTAVKPFTVVDHVPTPKLEDERSVEAEVTLYPKAGDPNPTASLSIAAVEGQKVIPVDLTSRYGDGFLIVRVTWNPFTDEVWAQITDRVQSWLELVAIDSTTGDIRRVLREESNTWVNVIGQPDFRDDGTFYWVSEREGTRDVYHYENDGELIEGVLVTPYDITKWSDSTIPGEIVYEAKAGSPLDRHTFRKTADGQVRLLTKGRGVHSVRFHTELGVVLDTVSTVEEPPVVRICDLDGNILRELPSIPSAQMVGLKLPSPELAIIEARDRFPLDVTVLRPDGEGPFPVFLDTYSGPNAPSVRNRFRPSAWHQFLRQEGVLVLQCNVRTASGRGQATTGLCHRRLGVQELKDLEDAVAWVCENHGGDPARVAISGWSYGGFMAGYALTHSDKFALGFAGAGVHDWQLYDTIYTERYMGTPQDNAEGYDETSVIDAAANLRGHLVILHGTIDDNVHLQNSVRLIDALQRAGKDDFEVMFYPRSRHGVRSRAQRAHMRRLMWRVIQRELLGSR